MTNASRFWDPIYHDVAGRLVDNISAIVQEEAPSLSRNVWLTETNSICHQGTFNITNAFANSLWLVDRFGLMAERGVPLMARQSLIGYNYSLLGNFPQEKITPSPDYFTTLLLRTLVGNRMLSTTPSFGVHQDSSSSNSRLRAFAYCSGSRYAAGALTVSAVNLDESQELDLEVDSKFCDSSQRYERFLLEPAWPTTGPDADAPPRDRVTSHKMLLNGKGPLSVGESGTLPPMQGVLAACSDDNSSTGTNVVSTTVKIRVPPLSFGFFVFEGAAIAACEDVH